FRPVEFHQLDEGFGIPAAGVAADDVRFRPLGGVDFDRRTLAVVDHVFRGVGGDREGAVAADQVFVGDREGVAVDPDAGCSRPADLVADDLVVFVFDQDPRARGAVDRVELDEVGFAFFARMVGEVNPDFAAVDDVFFDRRGADRFDTGGDGGGAAVELGADPAVTDDQQLAFFGGFDADFGTTQREPFDGDLFGVGGERGAGGRAADADAGAVFGGRGGAWHRRPGDDRLAEDGDGRDGDRGQRRPQVDRVGEFAVEARGEDDFGFSRPGVRRFDRRPQRAGRGGRVTGGRPGRLLSLVAGAVDREGFRGGERRDGQRDQRADGGEEQDGEDGPTGRLGSDRHAGEAIPARPAPCESSDYRGAKKVPPASVRFRRFRFALRADRVGAAEALRLAHRLAAGEAAEVVVVVDGDVVERFRARVGGRRGRIRFADGGVAARARRHPLRAGRFGARGGGEEVPRHLALVEDAAVGFGEFFRPR